MKETIITALSLINWRHSLLIALILGVACLAIALLEARISRGYPKWTKMSVLVFSCTVGAVMLSSAMLVEDIIYMSNDVYVTLAVIIVATIVVMMKVYEYAVKAAWDLQTTLVESHSHK